MADLFQRYCADPSSVEANVAAGVVKVTAALAGPDELDVILDRFRHGATPQEEMRFLYALADVRDPEQMARVLELSMSAEVRTQNAPFLIAACIANRDNGALAWKLVHERWDEMNERFPSNSIVRMMSGMRSVSDPALAADIEAFTAEHPLPQAKQTLQQHLERMRVSVGLRRADVRVGGSAARQQLCLLLIELSLRDDAPVLEVAEARQLAGHTTATRASHAADVLVHARLLRLGARRCRVRSSCGRVR